jgi:HEAT repeat protein
MRALMKILRRPSRPALPRLFSATPLLAAFFSVNAAALPVRLPLPGYAPAAPELRAAPRGDAAFPSAAGMFGDSTDPLSTLAVGGEDLKDSLNSPPTADALQKALRNASIQVRLAAIRAAAFPRDVAAVPSLSGVMLRIDQPLQLRAAAALALGRIGDRIAVGALSEALKDPSPAVRYAAALSLGKLPADGVATRLERVLRADPDWQPRYAAAIALGRTRKAFTASTLSDALTTDPAWQVRQQAARSLQDIGTAHAADALVMALEDDEPSVRAAAGTALVKIGNPVQRRAVAAAMRAEMEPAVKTVLAAAGSLASAQ